MMTVKATREGLRGEKMATGILVDDALPFVALPSTAALRLWVHVVNPRNHRFCRALVLDVGPWETLDHGYVFGGARPRAESGVDSRGRMTNGAGIDLGEFVWKALSMTDNDTVEWEFL